MTLRFNPFNVGDVVVFKKSLRPQYTLYSSFFNFEAKVIGTDYHSIYLDWFNYTKIVKPAVPNKLAWPYWAFEKVDNNIFCRKELKMAKFEVWSKETWSRLAGFANSSNNKPEDSFMTLDFAMEKARELSKTIVKKIDKYDYSTKTGMPKPIYKDETIDYFVLERSVPFRVRGFGISGKWVDSCDCRRCKNSGTDQKDYRLSCPACKGASWKPAKV
jgi:hypothetical protein